MSSVPPLGNARKIESPWPTSIAVISRMAGLACGCGVIFQTQVALVISRAIDAAAHHVLRRKRIIANRIVDADITIAAAPGVGTRMSAMRIPPSQCTGSEIAESAKPASAAGTFASQKET